jgi:large subunit ribosomal protein L24e
MCSVPSVCHSLATFALLALGLASQDSTFEFEKRHNTPVRYDRELMGATLRAMKRVSEIQQAREARFYKKRMDSKKESVKAAEELELRTNIDLIAPASVRLKDEVAVVETVKKTQKSKKMDIDG